jgi:predicted porin
MKKSTIALAVAAALAASAAAQAETTLYGSVRAGIQWTDPNNGNDNWQVKDESSRWGIKGSEDLGNGLSAIYQMEYGFNTANGGSGFSSRETWVGLKGGFGEVRLGNTESPYYKVSGRTDVFITSFWNYSLMGNTRRSNALTYLLPGGLPVTGGVQAVMDGGAGEDGVDEYSAGVNFEVGPFGAGVGYVSDEANNEDAWTVAASFDIAGASIGAAYESGDFDDQNRSACGNASGNGNDSDFMSVEAQYSLGATVLRGGWNRCDPDNANESDGWAIGFSHDLSSRTKVALEYQNVEAAGTNNDQDELAFHIRHSF